MRKYAMMAALAVATPCVMHAQSTTRQSSSGSIATSADDVREFQQMAQGDGCYTGTVDGVSGPLTRRAMTCERRKHSVRGNSMSALLGAMRDSSSTGASGSMGSMGRDSTSNSSSTTSPSSGMRPDSSMGRPDSSRAPMPMTPTTPTTPTNPPATTGTTGTPGTTGTMPGSTPSTMPSGTTGIPGTTGAGGTRPTPTVPPGSTRPPR